MTEARRLVMERIIDILPFGQDPSRCVTESSVLAELGITSLHLITMILALRKHYDIDVDLMMKVGLKMTVGDLATLVQGEASDDR
jgi:acyl carrier protein